ncbi:ATP-binding cassette domain-containing protein [Nisaea sp.]|uniref:ATP-binding cassette domain-containing protein n=1 Tax=Nisaea sp. TaxID=2024842 RepID=UPI002B267CC5|nr:ATP-binding cassette domain-containing protein [Nisaea sp.]
MTEPSAPSASPTVLLEHVAFQWPGSAFRFGVDRFRIEKAERVLLLGPSGGGKSTLLGLISGISPPQKGRIELLGTDLASLSSTQRDRFRAEHLGVIFQMFNLLPYASALDNVRLGLSFAPNRERRVREKETPEEAAARLLAALGLSEDIQTGQPASLLSSGQQQRVAAARALIGDPELVIADEPTSALDGESQQAFLELIFKQLDRSGSSLLMVSHDEGLSGWFDRVIRLADIKHREEAPDAATS